MPAWSQATFNFTKPVKFIVPYAPGGLPDTVARVFAQRIGERIGQGVVIENKPVAMAWCQPKPWPAAPTMATLFWSPMAPCSPSIRSFTKAWLMT
jgi:hypothetical protein